MGANRTARQPSLTAVLAVTMIATFMGIVDNFIVGVAVPSIRSDFSTDLAGAQSVAASYTLTYGVLLVPSGRLGDRYGTRAVFAVGMGIFTTASLLSSLAPTITLLVAARVLQAVGAAAFYPQVLTLLQQRADDRERSRAFSVLGFTLGFASIVGQVAGGVLVESDLWNLGWRMVFLVNVPLGLVTLIGALALLPTGIHGPGNRVDLKGAVLLTTALLALLLPLLYAERWNYSLWLVASLVVAAGLGAVFWRCQRTATALDRSPLIDTTLLARARFRRGLVVCIAFFAGNGGLFFILPVHLQGVEGMSPLQNGIAFLPLAFCFTTVSLIVPRVRAVSPPTLLRAGYVINLLGVLGLLTLAVTAQPGLATGGLGLALALIGLGMGLGLTPLAGEVLSQVPGGREGTASGVLETTIQVASAFGIAAAGLAYGAFGNTEPIIGSAEAQRPFVAAMVVYAALLVVALVTACRLDLGLRRGSTARPGGPDDVGDHVADADAASVYGDRRDHR